MANAICERAIGTLRRECLDWVIPLSEAHLRSNLREWVRHRWVPGASVRATSLLGGLHHEYGLVWAPVSA